MREITFDGQEGPHLSCPLINIWKDYANRGKGGIAATVEHGSKGVLLERKGARCKVQVGDIVGYVTFYFIKEEKGAWLARQFEGAK